jgi:hypothetical protein
MKNNYTLIFLTLSIMALLVLGATQQGCNQKSATTTFNTSALTLSFVSNAPPNKINTGTPFQIYVRTDNTGSQPVERGTAKFYLSGMGNNLKNLNPIMQNQEQLSEKTAQQDGGFEIIQFAESAESALSITNPFNFTLKADACYPYATSTQATICIGQVDGMCTLSGEKITTGSNTNAPIQITSITEQTQGNRLYVSFLIENKGPGQVFYSNFDCDKYFGTSSTERTSESLKENYVDVYVDPGQEDLKCTLQNPNGGESENSGSAKVGRKVTCTKIVGQQTYPTVIKINLAYKYINSVSSQLVIYP